MRRGPRGGALVRLLCLLGLLVGLLGAATVPTYAAAATKCAQPDGQRLTFTSGGLSREYFIKLPPGGARNAVDCALFGSSPLISRYETSRKFECFASCSIG